ncbi:hypothetical protein ABBQ32_010902 [Trebouxia sp. C0010 RCD-2024]
MTTKDDRLEALRVLAPTVGSSEASASDRDNVECKVPHQLCFTVVVLGASGDLAKKKTFPALFKLYSRGFLPANLSILGYARSKLSKQDLQDKVKPNLKGDSDLIDEFLDVLDYEAGPYDKPDGYKKAHEKMCERENKHNENPKGRLFYLALPPSVYPEVTQGIKENCCDVEVGKGGFVRVIVEKPFGKDLESSEELAQKLNSLFPEDQIYRIDHYLGKEMMQNMLVMRFANRFLGPMWNAVHISNVQICFKEPFGTEGRGGYFDEYGIIRDVMQNHMLQILALIAMEKPVSGNADDIRDEKVKVIRSIAPVKVEDVVLAQYAAAGDKPGYHDDDTVPKDSKAPTFATTVLRIHNERWDGVPFILKAGKALNERKVEIRIQFRPPAAELNQSLDPLRNELVIRLQPDEAIYLKIVVKKPGQDNTPIMSEMDLTYKERYTEAYIPEAYERLILDAIRGDQQHFVRRDELRAAWAVYTPLLHAIDAGKVELLSYPYGTRGPPQSDVLVSKSGFVKNAEYKWKPMSNRRSFEGPRL